jgi:CheY-like chemotaxis protein
MSRPRLLVAGTSAAIDTIEHLLGAEVDYVPARRLDDALHSLEAHPDMIVCNVRFDESRMFDLLQAAKTEPATRETPFVCIRLAPLPPSWRRCIEAAVLAIGATAFVDLSALERDRGRDAAEQALRDIVLAHLPHAR